MASNNSTAWLQLFEQLEGDVFSKLNEDGLKHHTLDDTREAHQRILSDSDKFSSDFDLAYEAIQKITQATPKGDELQLFHDYVGTVNRWISHEDQSQTPSLPALIAAFYEARGIAPHDVKSPSMRSSLVAAVLAEINHDFAFHNNAHFREVTFTHMMLLTQEENLAGVQFPDNYIADNIRRSLIHDLFVFGKDNNFRRENPDQRASYQSFYNEELPIEGTRPYWQQCGLSDEEIENDLVENLMTDLSRKPKGQVSGLKYSASDYLWMLSNHQRGGRRPQLPNKLKLFLSDERDESLYGDLTRGEYLTRAAAVKTDSDTLISAMCPWSSTFRTRLLQKEFPEKYPGLQGDGSYVGFLKYAFNLSEDCKRARQNTFFHSYSANKLFGAIAKRNFEGSLQRLAEGNGAEFISEIRPKAA